MGLFDRGVAKTKQSFFQKVSRAIVGKSRVDDSVLDAMEEALVATDMGVDTTLKIIDNLQDRVEKDKYVDMEELTAIIRDEIAGLMGDDAPAAEVPAVCNCKEKCAAGAVNTNCSVCKNNLSECSGKEPVTEPEPEPEQPEKKSSGGLLVIVLLLALAGGGAFAYVKFIKPKQGVKVSADPDDYDFEDEEYLTEDVADFEAEVK